MGPARGLQGTAGGLLTPGLQGACRGSAGDCNERPAGGLQGAAVGPPGVSWGPPGTSWDATGVPEGTIFITFWGLGALWAPRRSAECKNLKNAFLKSEKSTCIETPKGSRGGFQESHGAHKVMFSRRNNDISKNTHNRLILHLRGSSRRARWGPGPHTGRRWEPQKCRCAPFPRFRRPFF